jgi:CubicO group peptidase (beta-lactamase class C family)
MQHYRLKYTFIIALFLTGFTAQAQQPVYNQDIEAKIKQVENNLSGWLQIQDSVNEWNLQQRMAHYNLRGLSIAVVHNYKIEWARGYGLADTATQKPVTTQTLFQAGSISKSLNGVGVLKLVQDKKLDLYADINQYLRTWKFPYDSLTKGKKISTANLLSHTAGLTVHGFPGYANGDTIPALTEVLNGTPPANTRAVRSQFEPGLLYQYSGGGTTISQLLLQDVTDQAYDAYMWQKVLQPMGMTMSSYTQPPAKDKQQYLATGYRDDGKEVDTKYHVYPEQAAAGLWTNPTDLCKYIIETQLSLQGSSNKVLDQQMTTLRLTPYVDSSAALGVFITQKGNDKYFSHNGADEGFLSAYTGSFTNGNGVVVMVNSDNSSILNEVINSVAKVYGWKDYYKPIVKKIITPAAEVLAGYNGDYSLAGDTLTLSTTGGQSFFTVNRSDVFKIYYTADEGFFANELSFAFSFEKDATGKLTGFYFMRGNKKMSAVKL